MKLFIVSFWLLLASFGVEGQTLAPVDSASSVTFKIKNLGFNTSGTIGGLAGIITYSPENITGSHFDVTVKTETVNTGVDMRDEHLRKEEYLDVKNHPQIRFVSDKITTSNKKGTLFVFGKLTLKGVTKDISFPFTAQPTNEGYLFEGTFQINRRDFNVGGSGSTLGDNLTITLKVQARKG